MVDFSLLAKLFGTSVGQTFADEAKPGDDWAADTAGRLNPMPYPFLNKLVQPIAYTGKSVEPGMGLEGGEPYQGGAAKSYGTQWAPDEVALVQKHFGVEPAKWAKLDHSTQFHLLMEASDKEQASTGQDPWLEASPMEQFQPSWYDQPRSPFNIDEAVARHQASVERPPELLRAFHGTTTGPTGKLGPYYSGFGTEGNPDRFMTPEYRSERGVFFTDDPDTASAYGGGDPKVPITSGSKVFPVDLDMSNSVTVDLKKLGVPAEQRWYDPRIVQTAIETAKQNNRDFVVIKGMKDIGGEADQIIAVRPSGKVRSALTGETLFGMLAGLFGAGGPRRKNAQQGTQAPDPANTQ